MGWTSGAMWKNYTQLRTDDIRDFLIEREGEADTTRANERFRRAKLAQRGPPDAATSMQSPR